jgi:hypothetical protein
MRNGTSSTNHDAPPFGKAGWQPYWAKSVVLPPFVSLRNKRVVLSVKENGVVAEKPNGIPRQSSQFLSTNLYRAERVKRVTVFRLLLSVLVLASSSAVAQDKSRPTVAPPPDSSSRAVTIITKVPFDGVNYFIKIVPLDTTVRDRMPIYNPVARRTLIWTDSLQHLLPDSLLKYLQRRGDLFRLIPKNKRIPQHAPADSTRQ